jgi:cytoskeleton protein RodZ
MKEFAEKLKTERLRRGLTLRAISECTRINTSILRALEQGKFELIGHPSIADGLLREYGLALGVRKESTGTEFLIYDSKEKKSGSRQIIRERRILHKGLVTGFLLGIISAGILLGSFWLLKETGYPESEPAATQLHQQENSNSKLMDHNITSTPEEIPVSNSQIEQAAPLGEEAEQTQIADFLASSEPDEGKAAALSSLDKVKEDSSHLRHITEHGKAPPALMRDTSAHHLNLQVDQKTWIQVQIDGKVTESDLLQAGEKREWKVKESAKVVLGNGGGVHMQWDGEPIQISDKPKRVIRLVLPDHLKK